MDKITKIKIDNVEFWIEPKFMFMHNCQFFFKELADGGIVSYAIDMDDDPSHVRFWAPNNPILLKLRTILFEKQIGLTTDET